MKHYDEQLLENIYASEDGSVVRKTKIRKTNSENYRAYEETSSDTKEECYGQTSINI